MFFVPPPPPLKLLKLSLVLCCYAVGPEVMLNQWSPGRLMWLRWCFLHPWKTVSNQDNSMVLAIMQFSIADGVFNPPPPPPPKSNAITMAMVVAVMQSVQWWRPITGLACNSFWRTATTCGEYSRTIPREQRWKTRRICCLQQVEGQLVGIYVCYCPFICMYICPKAKITMMIYHDLRVLPKSCNIPKCSAPCLCVLSESSKKW